MERVSTKEFFEKGCLLGLQIRIWGTERKIRETEIRAGTADPEWVKGLKKLVHKESLAEIKHIANRARGYVYRVSLPFPSWGLNFVPRDLMVEVDSKLTEYKEEFDYKVDEFLRHWDQYIVEARIRLGNLFREEDYPSAPEDKFSFWWQFLELTGPESLTVVSPYTYQKEVEKLVRTLEEASEVMVMALREEFINLVEVLSNGLKTGHMKQSTLDRFEEWLKLFKSRNIFNDTELEMWVERASNVLRGVTKEDLKDDNFRERIHKAFEPVMQFAEENIVRIKRRKIRVPDKSAA